MILKNLINRSVFFVGWVLSPFTFWNDAFVNIPISYLSASILYRFIKVKFVLLVLVCYWASNLLGIVMMYVSGKDMFRNGKGILRELVKLLVTMAVYSGIVLLLSHLKVLKPI